MPSVYKNADGTYRVEHDGEVLETDLTNAEAWRKVDLLEYQLVNRSQGVSDFLWNQHVNRDLP